MTKKDNFERQKKDISTVKNEAWEKLFNLLNKNILTCYDFISCICCKLAAEQQKTFKAQLPIAGYDFVIEIKKITRDERLKK